MKNRLSRKNIALRAEKPYLAMHRFFFSEAMFLLTKYVTALQEAKMRGGYFAQELAHEEKYSP